LCFYYYRTNGENINISRWDSSVPVDYPTKLKGEIGWDVERQFATPFAFVAGHLFLSSLQVCFQFFILSYVYVLSYFWHELNLIFFMLDSIDSNITKIKFRLPRILWCLICDYFISF
jgi:hypothetical protein